ncbi:M48 family metalloprotease [Nonomuraea sp. NPDC004354]
MTAAREPAAGPRLNPFVLPSSTTSRFLILIAATFAASLYLSTLHVELWWSVSGAPEHVRQAPCLSALRSGAASSDDPRHLVEQYAGCARTVMAGEGLLRIVPLLAPALLAVLLYAVHPVWARRRRPVPLAEAGTGAGHEALTRRLAIVAAQELPGRRVRLVVDSARGGITGRTFGLPGRHVVALSMGLVMAHADRPAVAEAVLRHELAHIRNRDVGIAHFTVAIWWSFLLATCLPALVLTALWRPLGLVFLGVVIPVIALVLWLARTAVLRAREHHADVRAGDTPDRREGMAAAVETVADPPLRGPFRFFTSHPRAQDRRDVLDEPGRLLRLNQWEMFAAGLLAGLGFVPVVAAVFFLDFEAPLEVRYHLPGLVLGFLVAGIVVVAVWRATGERLAGQGPKTRLWWAAVSFTAGLIAGQLPVTIRADVWIWTIVLNDPLLGLVHVLVVLLLFRALLGWARACCSAWLATSRRPRWITLVAVVVSALVIGPWLGMWFHGTSLIVQAGDSWSVLVLVLVAMARLVPELAAVTLACAFLVGAGIGRRSAQSREQSLHLDGAAPVPLRRPYSRLVRALLPTAVACALMVPAGFLLHPMLAGRQAAERLAVAAYALVGTGAALLALSGLVIGVTVGGRSRVWWGVAHAGLALPVACAPMLLLLYGHSAVARCGPQGAGRCFAGGALDPPAFGNSYLHLVTYTLYAGLALAAVGGLLRRTPAGVPRTRGAGARRLLVAVVTVPAILTAAATGYTVLRSWLPTVGIGTPAPFVWLPQVAQAARRPVRPGSVAWLDACRYARGLFASPQVRDGVNADQRYYLLTAQMFTRVGASDDAALRAFAGAGLAWMAEGRADMAGRTVGRTLHYCILAGREHKIEL